MKSQCLHLSIPHKPGWPLFAIPSLVGIIFYLAPIYYQDAIATPIALLVTGLQSLFHDQLPAMITFLICFTAITPIIAKAVKPDLSIENKLLKCILHPSKPHFVVRLLGFVLVLAIFFDAGPEILCHPATGSMILNNILPAVFLSLMVGGLLLPLLLNFDGFVKSPISALRFIPRHCGVR